MSYRDDLAAAQARADSLERKLSQAENQIRRLTKSTKPKKRQRYAPPWSANELPAGMGFTIVAIICAAALLAHML